MSSFYQENTGEVYYIIRLRVKIITIIIGVFGQFWSGTDKESQTPSREQIGAGKKCKECQAHRSCPLFFCV